MTTCGFDREPPVPSCQKTNEAPTIAPKIHDANTGTSKPRVDVAGNTIGTVGAGMGDEATVRVRLDELAMRLDSNRWRLESAATIVVEILHSEVHLHQSCFLGSLGLPTWGRSLAIDSLACEVPVGICDKRC